MGREKITSMISGASKLTRISVLILMQATIQCIFIHLTVMTKKENTVDSLSKKPKDFYVGFW
jgi:hypothetical protein